MKKLLAGLLFAFSSAVAAQAFTPVEGHYYDPDQSGTGYDIQVQNGQMVVAIYSYNVDGSAQWYLVICPLLKDKSCTGSLQRYAGGQSIGGGYEPARRDGTDGTAVFKWLSESKLSVALPMKNGATIVPLAWGYAGAKALLGDWAFVAFRPDGSTVSTPVISFVKTSGNQVSTADGLTYCVALPAALYNCAIVDAKAIVASWTFKLTANAARGTTGNTLDGDIIVQGWRLNPGADPLPPEVTPLD